ncbi:hypothetical protein ACROYT_G032369 [Oculina patagonica]
MLSLNVRGIRSTDKRKALFNWLGKEKYDVIFLQETYSTPGVVNIWKSQWRGDIFFSHGTEHSKGVMILFKENFDYEIKVHREDEQGRFIILKSLIQSQPFVFVNIYAPNKIKKQCDFFEEIQKQLDQIELEESCEVIIGGDFNVILDANLDGSGGKPQVKESCKNIENFCSSYDLIDIWRIRNPDIKRFTWRQKNPVVQRRLDFWLITSSLQEEVENVDIIPAIRSDHLAISIHINGIEETERGPSFWKFNSSLLEDEDYIKVITDKYGSWLEEGKDIQDPRVLWDFVKYKIRYETITYSKQKAKRRRDKLSALEEKIKECTANCDEHPIPENINNLEILQTEYNRHYEYIAQGAIIRSRVNWYEHGEKSNKYFLNLENYKKKKSCIRKLVVASEECTTDPKEIMTEIHTFYANLYDTDSCDRDDLSTDEFLRNINTKVLSDEQRELLDKKITTNEYFEALKSFQNNKTPGNDGLTVEFYIGFWHLIWKCLTDALNFAHEHGQLSSSQKQAMITLLEKKDKDRRFVKNWRPISLINVDVKIASKAIAKRLESILPNLIHPNQNGFIKGRSIVDGVRTIEDVLEFAQFTDCSGILMAIDFEKAFDSLNHTFLFKVLEKFNFGPYFLQWIKMFYANVSSCVLNNGFITDLFPVRCGVRQGDPLSPLLFILALETLACRIREDNEIKGSLVKENEIKLTLFADDMTSFLRDIASYHRLLATLQLFSRFSNLKVNNEKTEIFAIGRHRPDQTNYRHEVRTSIKILGIVFDYNTPLRMKANFDSVLKSTNDLLNMWKWRGLTLLGKIQIVKSFIIPKVLSKASLITVTEDFIKEINSLIYRFIWKGNDKIKRAALINDIENGGLKMLDMQSMIFAQRVMILKRFADKDNDSSWKITLNYFLSKAASQSDELPVTTQEHLVVVTGPANRLSLTKEILDFCGALPIYKTEVFPNPVKEQNGTFSKFCCESNDTSETADQFHIESIHILPSQSRETPLKIYIGWKMSKILQLGSRM